MPCWPADSPVPKLARDAAVVDGNAESSDTGTWPWPACMDRAQERGVGALLLQQVPAQPVGQHHAHAFGGRKVQFVLEPRDTQAGRGAGEHLGDGTVPERRGGRERGRTGAGGQRDGGGGVGGQGGSQYRDWQLIFGGLRLTEMGHVSAGGRG